MRRGRLAFMMAGLFVGFASVEARRHEWITAVAWWVGSALMFALGQWQSAPDVMPTRDRVDLLRGRWSRMAEDFNHGRTTDHLAVARAAAAYRAARDIEQRTAM